MLSNKTFFSQRGLGKAVFRWSIEASEETGDNMFNDSLPDGIRRAAAAEGMLPLHFPEEERGKIPDRMPEIERMLIALRRKLAEELAGSRERAEIAELQVYIAEHCTEKLTRKELAGRVYLSESHLSKIFRDATGKRMVDYIREIRMLKAMDLVMNTRKPIREIADLFGMPSASYFTEQFRKEFGKAPTAYRN